MTKPQGIDLKKIADEIKASGKDYEEAISEYFLNPQQTSRVRNYLGINLRTGMTSLEREEKLTADLAAAIERAKKRRQPRAERVVYFGKEYWDVTPLFIDCGG